MIDAMIEPDYIEKLLEACDGALLFASSCILGYQVYDGYVVAKAVRERYPDLPIIWGGWFPSVIPEMYLEEGIADAVGIGQGELTFREVCEAVATRRGPWPTWPAWPLMRDGQALSTPPPPGGRLRQVPARAVAPARVREVRRPADASRRT